MPPSISATCCGPQVFDPSKVTDLGDIQHESQLQELGVRQLKIILQKNCINYKGCVEKQELLERVVRLWHSRKEEKGQALVYYWTPQNYGFVCSGVFMLQLTYFLFTLNLYLQQKDHDWG